MFLIVNISSLQGVTLNIVFWGALKNIWVEKKIRSFGFNLKRKRK